VNFQDIREDKQYFLGGILYLAVYTVYNAVNVISRGIKDISGWYLLIPFSLLAIVCFFVSLFLLYKSVKSVKSGTSVKHNLPFWASVWGDLGYFCIVYSIVILFC